MRLAFILLFLTVTFLFAETKKIMVDLKTGNMDAFTTQFLGGVPGTADYFIAQGDSVEIAVVIHGDAYKFFVQNLENTQYGVDQALVENQEKLHKRLLEITGKYKIKLEMCQVGMNKRGILTEDIYPFVKPIKSAMTGLVEWQSKGYAYIPLP